MSSVILTTAINYQLFQIKPFLDSLDKIFDGKLVIFTNNILRIKTYSYDIEQINVNDSIWEDEVPINLNSPNNRRYYWYHRYLLQCKEYSSVLLSDIRDVVFQRNPFHCINSDELFVAIEEEKIKNCRFNSCWIHSLFGDKYFEKVKDNEIVCSGTTMGHTNAIMDYLTTIRNLLQEYGEKLDTGNNVMIIDQGLHNYYCFEYPGKVKPVTNKNGFIFTMGYATSFAFNSNGQMLNTIGEVYSILHQYDRFPFIVRTFERQDKIVHWPELKNAFKSFLRNRHA